MAEPKFKIPIKRDWLNKGFNTIADFLDSMRNVIYQWRNSLMCMILKQTFWNTMLLIPKSKLFLNEKKFLYTPLSRNRSLNTLLNLREKGCSELYTRMKAFFEHTLDNIL